MKSEKERGNTPSILSLHERAKKCAEELKRREYEMIEALMEVDERKAYRFFGAASLFQYAVSFLDLGESRSYDFICVARKAKKVAALQLAVKEKKPAVSLDFAGDPPA